MNLENRIIPNAMVTKELVREVACSDPNKFISEDGEMNLYKVLQYLGFKISHNFYNKDIVFMKDILVRTRDRPYMVYRTDVYKGHLSKKKVGRVNNKPLYEYHKLYDWYDVETILQPTDISKYVIEEELINITEVGFY